MSATRTTTALLDQPHTETPLCVPCQATCVQTARRRVDEAWKALARANQVDVARLAAALSTAADDLRYAAVNLSMAQREAADAAAAQERQQTVEERVDRADEAVRQHARQTANADPFLTRIRALERAVRQGASNPPLIKRANRLADDLQATHPEIADRLRVALTTRGESLGNRAARLDDIRRSYLGCECPTSFDGAFFHTEHIEGCEVR